MGFERSQSVVFASNKVTEYCGELKNEKDSKKMMDDGTDTHILGLSPMFVSIDGSIHGQFDMEWYCGGGGHTEDRLVLQRLT